jgi:hypothetical protein
MKKIYIATCLHEDGETFEIKHNNHDTLLEIIGDDMFCFIKETEGEKL